MTPEISEGQILSLVQDGAAVEQAGEGQQVQIVVNQTPSTRNRAVKSAIPG